MDKFWPIVCNYYGISASEQDISIRNYKLVTFDDLPLEKTFKGEVSRLNSYHSIWSTINNICIKFNNKSTIIWMGSFYLYINNSF